MTEKWKPSPWQRIMRAADRGRGLRLSAEEILQLSMDRAIQQVAENDDEEEILYHEEEDH